MADVKYYDNRGRLRSWTEEDESAYQRDLAKRKPLSETIDARLSPGVKAKPDKPKPRAFVIGVRG